VGKAMGGAFVAVYLSVMSAGAVAAGYALNAAFGLFDLPLPELSHPHHHESVNWWSMVFAAVFTVTLLGSIYRKVRPYLRIKSGQGPAVEAAATGTVRLTVEGMTCSRCADHVTGAIRSVRGVTGVRVDVKTKSAVVSGAFDDAALLAAVADAGYTAAVTA